LDITVYTPEDKDTSHHRINKGDLSDIKIVWYKGKKIRLLKDILPLQKFDLSGYDKVYSMCQGFLLNRKLIPQSKKFLLGIHAQSTLAKQPIEPKLWKRIFFKILYPINIHYIKKADEIRIQNKDDKRRLFEIGFEGKIWNVPPSMFDTTPEPIMPWEFFVIWFNRVTPEKRPEKLLEIAQHLKDVKFCAIGSGPLSFMLKVRKNIEYLGFLPEEQLSDMLRKASLCVMTSRGENFGMSAIEAQAYGVPTLSYNVMGLRDYNETVEDITEMVKRILDYKNEFLKDKEGYMMRRKLLRDYTLREFSNKVVIPQIKEMITK
jgi:glycosyltransferase involved in cell wall biosynthesis